LICTATKTIASVTFQNQYLLIRLFSIHVFVLLFMIYSVHAKLIILRILL